MVIKYSLYPGEVWSHVSEGGNVEVYSAHARLSRHTHILKEGCPLLTMLREDRRSHGCTLACELINPKPLATSGYTVATADSIIPIAIKANSCDICTVAEAIGCRYPVNYQVVTRASCKAAGRSPAENGGLDFRL